jgi:hypothetical protein
MVEHPPTQEDTMHPVLANFLTSLLFTAAFIAPVLLAHAAWRRVKIRNRCRHQFDGDDDIRGI